MPTEDSLEIIEELAQEQTWLQEAKTELASISLGNWQAEHARLFINGHPKICCPPFESAYRHGIMNGPSCHQIKQFYQSIGLEAVEGISPDYLGMMLECAAYLLEQQSTDKEFATHWETLWQDHLKLWVPQFAEDLQRYSDLRLYQQLGLKLKELF